MFWKIFFIANGIVFFLVGNILFETWFKLFTKRNEMYHGDPFSLQRMMRGDTTCDLGLSVEINGVTPSSEEVRKQARKEIRVFFMFLLHPLASFIWLSTLDSYSGSDYTDYCSFAIFLSLAGSMFGFIRRAIILVM